MFSGRELLIPFLPTFSFLCHRLTIMYLEQLYDFPPNKIHLRVGFRTRFFFRNILQLLFWGCYNNSSPVYGRPTLYSKLNSWIKIDQLDVTCFIISLFTAQHVSNVSTSIFGSLRLIVDLFHVLYCSGSMCVGVTVWFGWVVWYPYAGWNTIKMMHSPINLRSAN